MKPLLLLLFLCGCAIRGEGGKVLLMDDIQEDGTGCQSYLGRKLVLKCRF